MNMRAMRRRCDRKSRADKAQGFAAKPPAHVQGEGPPGDRPGRTEDVTAFRHCAVYVGGGVSLEAMRQLPNRRLRRWESLG
jgi:hypothetical protein